jgi:6-phosphogluconolactonase
VTRKIASHPLYESPRPEMATKIFSAPVQPPPRSITTSVIANLEVSKLHCGDSFSMNKFDWKGWLHRSIDREGIRMKPRLRNMARSGVAMALLAALTACGGGNSTPVTPPTYTVGGTITGLAGHGLVLENSIDNHSPDPDVLDDLAVSGTGSFTFRVPLGSGVNYGIGVKTQPLSPPEFCQVANGSGTVGAANVTGVQVTCAAGYTAGGTVSGLVGSGLVLQIESYDPPGDRNDPVLISSPLPVKTDGKFTLDTIYPSMFTGGDFGGDFVGVMQKPSSPTQRCVVDNAKISIQGANDTSVAVLCAEFAYVANSADNSLSAYRVDATSGALLAVGTPIATGKSPYAVVGTTSKRFVYVANKGSNDVSAFAVNVETGVLTAVSGSPFAAGTDPEALTLYRDSIDAATGALTPPLPATYATGQGPSSVAAHPLRSFLYVANNGGSNDISAFLVDAETGGLTPMAGSPFAAGANPLSLAFGLEGKFLYSANPGGTKPSISGFTVNVDGPLVPLSGSPFSTAVSSNITNFGAYLFFTSVAAVAEFGIDPTTGLLSAISSVPVVLGANVNSITRDPADQFLYLANAGSMNVSGFSVDTSTGGTLTPIPGSPFAAGNSPDSLTTL